MHPRSEIRTVLRTMLAHSFPTWTVLRAWTQNIDPSALPAVAVFTPRETQRQDGVRSYSAETEVFVQMRRSGGDDLEDTLDDDSTLIECCVMPVLLEIDEHAQLVSTDIDIGTEGEHRIGKLNMAFRTMRLFDKTY